MNNPKRLCAINLFPRILCASVGVVGLACTLQNGMFFSNIESILILLFCGYSVVALLYLTINRIYLTEYGVECNIFGKLKRKLHWNNVSQICIIRDFRFSAKTSGTTRIVIIPDKCAQYNAKDWCGFKYLFVFRKQVIWIDNTKRNRDFIELVYGDLVNYR